MPNDLPITDLLIPKHPKHLLDKSVVDNQVLEISHIQAQHLLVVRIISTHFAQGLLRFKKKIYQVQHHKTFIQDLQPVIFSTTFR